MKTITILTGRYLPGYKDGGPVRTLINLTDCLGKEYRFKIITNDRDHGDKEPYKNIKYNEPNQIGNAEVWYVKPNGFTLSLIYKVTADADLIYICGPYDDYAYKTLILKRLRMIKKPIVVASMGSFSTGAFQIRVKKKQIFMRICKILGLFKSITWSVTSNLEEIDVKRMVNKKANCMIAEDLPRRVPELVEENYSGDIRIIFLSRISEKKNLLYAIEILKEVTSNIIFDIYGPIEEIGYWEKCQKKLNELPYNIKWSYKGMADSKKIIEVFSQYDVFFFPTRGENFGHVIFEALAGGCIPIISDQTPWNDLEEKKCGRVIPLSNPEEFRKTIDEIAKIPREELRFLQYKANDYAKEKYTMSVKYTGYRKIFR